MIGSVLKETVGLIKTRYFRRDLWWLYRKATTTEGSVVFNGVGGVEAGYKVCKWGLLC